MENELFKFIEKYTPMSIEEKKALSDLNIFRSVKKGKVLLKEGQYSTESYFVLKGCIRSFYIVDGDERTTEFYTEMEGVSSPCIISKLPSEFYISCVEDSILSFSDVSMEIEIFQKFPKFERLCRILSEQMLAKNQRNFDDYKTSSPEQRYLHLLKNRSDLLQCVPHHQLASYLGIKPQSLSMLRARILGKKY